MRVAVASGKGGTGKTTVSVNLAASLAAVRPVQVVDCDVEEPNAGLFLRPTIRRETEVSLPVPAVKADRCTGCGACAQACAFNAIVVLGRQAIVFPELCHGCGACVAACTYGALAVERRRLGTIAAGVARGGSLEFLEGRIDTGVSLAVPVIRALKRQSRDAGVADVIYDAPPGTACPVVATLRDSDFVILVTEPTPFGRHDLGLAVQLVEELGLPCGVVINRIGIGDAAIDEFCAAKRIPILMAIPFDRLYAEAIAAGELLVDRFPEWRSRFIDLWRRIEGMTS